MRTWRMVAVAVFVGGATHGPLGNGTNIAAADPPGPIETTAAVVQTVLPNTLGEPAEIVERRTGMRVRFRVLGATSSEATVEGSVRRYVAALGGETFERLALPDGAEDFVVLRPGSKLSELRYAIALHRVAGLRFVGRSLEFLDPAGTPRLRVAPPFVILRDGTRHDVEMRLDGCDADRRPTPPWGREVVAPGSPECELTVSWDPVLAKSGAVLDPAWTATQDMAVGRLEHGAVLMDDGCGACQLMSS